MRVTIEIRAAEHDDPRKADMLRNMEALRRAVHAAPPADVTLLVDTLSILEGIYQKLPE